MPATPQFVVISKTATNDNPFQLTYNDMWFKELDIFVYDNDCDIGGMTVQDITVLTNDVYTVKGYVNAKEIYFANSNAGNNAKVVIAGTQASDSELKKDGIN